MQNIEEALNTAKEKAASYQAAVAYQERCYKDKNSAEEVSKRAVEKWLSAASATTTAQREWEQAQGALSKAVLESGK